MKLVHIVAGAPPGSGIAEAVSHLCVHLRRLGHEVTLATLDGPVSGAASAAEAAGVRLVRFRPCGPRALHFSWQMLRRLRRVCADADVVHVHSNWTFPVWWGCRCALREGKRLVMAPHGCFDPVRLRHAAWKKRLVGWIDRSFLRRAHVIHVTSEMEREWAEAFLRTRSGRRSGDGRRETGDGKAETKGDGPRLVVVPNGVEVRPRETGDGRRVTGDGRRETGDGGRSGSSTPPHTHTPTPPHTGLIDPSVAGPRKVRTVLYLGRLHPLKGLDLLVEAWGSLAGDGGRETGDGGREIVGSGQWAVGSGQWAVGSGQWAVGSGQWAVGSGQWAVGSGSGASGNAQCSMPNAECPTPNGECPSGPHPHSPTLPHSHTPTLPHSHTPTPPHSHTPTPPHSHTPTSLGWRLVIAGPDEQGMSRRLREEADRLGVGDTIDFAGPVYGGDKERLLAGADLFVLPSRSENFGIVVAEALAAGVPVITTRGTPWAELLGVGEQSSVSSGQLSVTSTQNSATDGGRCGWWVAVGVGPLAGALREAMALSDEERRAMGENGWRLVAAKYRWEAVAARMAEVYERIPGEW